MGVVHRRYCPCPFQQSDPLRRGELVSSDRIMDKHPEDGTHWLPNLSWC